MYRLCFQAAIFKLNMNTISTCCVSYVQRKLREIQVNRYLYETCKEIYIFHTNSERKDYFVKAQRNIHCYPAYTFSRMNYCQLSTVVTTYLCCCLNNKRMVILNVKIMIIQPEETLVPAFLTTFPCSSLNFRLQTL